MTKQTVTNFTDLITNIPHKIKKRKENEKKKFLLRATHGFVIVPTFKLREAT